MVFWWWVVIVVMVGGAEACIEWDQSDVAYGGITNRIRFSTLAAIKCGKIRCDSSHERERKRKKRPAGSRDH